MGRSGEGKRSGGTRVSLPVSLVMLNMQTYKDNGWAFDKTCNGASAAGDPERIELFAGGRLDHPVEFLEIQTSVVTKLLKGK